MIDNFTKKMIDDDIKMCKLMYKVYLKCDLSEDEIEELKDINLSEDDIISLFVGMHSRYSSLINDFPDDINIEKMVDCDDEIADYRLAQYLKNVKEKLETFKRMGYIEMKKDGSPNIVIHNENNNHNENNLSNTFLSFHEAKQRIENMSALTDDDIEEILQKINQLENIINSSDRKSKKWENVKGIVKWVADKSFDVAKVVLPLVLKME